MSGAAESRAERRRREKIEERARKVLETQPEPRPGESYDEFNRRLAEWSEQVSRAVTDPELAAELTRQSNDQGDRLIAERMPEGQIPVIYESYHRLEPGLECQITKQAAGILARADWPLDDFVEEHFAKSEKAGQRHIVRRSIITDHDSVTAAILLHKPLLLIWAHGEMGEEDS